MKTNRRNETVKTAPPTDECVACGAEDSYTRALTSTQKDLRGETFTVEHHHWKCSQCGVAVLGDAEMDEAMRATVAAYQCAHDLLTAEEICTARDRMKWSQSELADRTRLGLATIKRLEGGGVVQTETNDECLRAALGSALNGAFVFMYTEKFGVVEAHLTESWEKAWTPPVKVRDHEVALDVCFDYPCFA